MQVLFKEDLVKVWAKIVDLFATKASVTKLETVVNTKATKATTLAGYGIEDAYTKTEVDETVSGIKNDIASVYKYKGSITFAELPTSGMVVGDTYNITDAFVITEAFNNYVSGEEKSYPAGTNVSYTESGWDCLGGIYDFSEYAKKTDLPTHITDEELDAICVLPSDVTAE